jgi:hypothetical protein
MVSAALQRFGAPPGSRLALTADSCMLLSSKTTLVEASTFLLVRRQRLRAVVALEEMRPATLMAWEPLLFLRPRQVSPYQTAASSLLTMLTT